MISVFPLDLVPAYPTPFAACRYVAPFSRSQGGAEINPPPAVRVRLRPPAVRVIRKDGCILFNKYKMKMLDR